MIETTISSNGSANNNNPSNSSRGKLQEKLLPKAIVTKRRRKQDTSSVYDGSQDESNEDLMPPPSRGRNAASSDDAGSEEDDPLAGSLSNRSLQTRSYTSYVPPPQDPSAFREGRTPVQTEFDRAARTSTLPVNTPVSDTADSIPVPGFSLTKTGLAPPASRPGRSPSPGGRFRDVFKSKKNPSPAIANPDSSTQLADASKNGKSADSPTPSIASAAGPFITTEVSILSSASTEEPSHAPKVKATEKLRRLSKGHGHKVEARPHTPPTNPSNDTAAPKIVTTPPTTSEATRANVVLTSHLTASPEKTTGPIPSTSVSAVSDASSPPSANNSMISQRRARTTSIGPSKLSNFTLAPPLPPTPENGPISPSSGFFSSMLSAAQSATTSLSTTITSTNITTPWNNNNSNGSLNKNPATPLNTEADSNDGVEVESSHDSAFTDRPSSEKEPAVKTLGLGDLSLSQLGIVEQPEKETLPTSAALPLANAGTHGLPRMTEISTETRLRSESAPADPTIPHTSPEVLDHGASNAQGSAGRPSSVSVSDAGHEDNTPQSTSIYDDKDKPDAVQRTDSIKSAIVRRRHRGSSAATGGTSTTIAAAIAAANASVAHPMASGSTPKLTGFAVASKKRNRDFHNFFKSVPDDDYLIEDYSCALQREILAHGRLYVSEGYLCFSSNILGWVTTLVMSFDEIVSVEKRSTALVFKNGLMISTLHAKHVFASFASRDSTYDLIVKIWKLGHPSLQSSLNGVRIDETGGDKTEKIDEGDAASVASRSLSMSDDDESEDDSDEVYDEDAEDEDLHESAHATESNSAATEPKTEKSVSRKPSGTTTAAASGPAADKPKDAVAAPAGGDFPGPPTHAPTDCGDTTSHYERVLADEVIAAPLGKVFSYVFGSTSTTWMIKWLSNDQKCFDIQAADKKGLSAENKTRTISYTKPLNSSIGPKQTKCVVTEQIESIDFEKAIHVVCLTQTPDVPSGNVFTVKTKYCLSWGENNGTRVQMNCTIEWTGKSWLKAPIEKGANDGQTQYSKDLFAGLKEALSSSPRTGAPNGGPGKGKKKGRKNKAAPASPTDETVPGAAKKKPQEAADWGLLEPVHGILGPVLDIVQPLLTGNIMYGILVGLLVATWFGFGFPSNRQQQLVPGGYDADLRYRASYPERLAAYDEMWRREESELWDWLEERVGLDRLNGEVASGAAAAGASGTASSRKVLEPRVVEGKLREERMDSQDIQEAIRITEEKLKVLRSVVERQEKV